MPKACTIDSAIKRVRELVQEHFPGLTPWDYADTTNEILDQALNTWGLGAYEKLIQMSDEEVFALLLHTA